MRKIRITEDILHQIPENTVKSAFNIQENYQLTDKEELLGYLQLKSANTCLSFSIYVDDGEAYIRDQHPLLLFVEVSSDIYVPISIEQTPQILNDDLNGIISDADLLMINEFIVANLDSLVQLANGQISQSEFIKNIVESKGFLQ